MQRLRDNPDCAQEEYDGLLDERDPGLSFRVTFDVGTAPGVRSGRRPRLAVLREQGVNGQLEMAAAFDRAGFECVDVHMTDLLRGRMRLNEFRGLVACGGFSYGDVLGAGSGWAKSILFNEELKRMFARFFERPGTFALGVCNGCQMMAQLKDIIPGAEGWPAFVRNRSEQFEARTVTVEIMPSPSVLLAGMAGSRVGIPVAHGEGRTDFEATGSLERVREEGLMALRFVDNYGRAAERYPFNPNGSPLGITGLTSADGRVTIMMPHPERVFRSVQMSYRPPGLFEGEDGPWLRMFQNAREYVG
jgi:phosphoribosylformylglycinamidine synthase